MVVDRPATPWSGRGRADARRRRGVQRSTVAAYAVWADRPQAGYGARPMRVSTIDQNRRAATPTRSRSACSRARSRPPSSPAALGELLASGEARHSFKALALTHADGPALAVGWAGSARGFHARARPRGGRRRPASAPARSPPARSAGSSRATATRRSRRRSCRARCSATTASSATSRPPQARRAATDEPPKHLERLIVAGHRTDSQAAVAEATLVARGRQPRPRPAEPSGQRPHPVRARRATPGRWRGDRGRCPSRSRGATAIIAPRHGRLRRRRPGLRRRSPR